jgi:hypothetical protein
MTEVPVALTREPVDLTEEPIDLTGRGREGSEGRDQFDERLGQ